MNCTELKEYEYIPTVAEAFNEMGWLGLVLVILGACITATVLGVFLEELCYLHRHWQFKHFSISAGCLAVFPIGSLCFFLTILMPQVNSVTTTTATLYQPLSMVLFFKLIVSYAGGEERLKDLLEGQKVPLKGPPFCWICRCCPTTFLSRKMFRFLKVSIYQLFFAPLVLFFIMGLCIKTGVYTPGELLPSDAAPYIALLSAASFFLGVYGLVIFTRMTSANMKGFNIRGKYLALQTFFVLTRFHVLVFDALGTQEILPCYPPISSTVTGYYIRSALLLGEGFILATIARSLFLHTPPTPLEICEAAQQHHIS